MTDRKGGGMLASVAKAIRGQIHESDDIVEVVHEASALKAVRAALMAMRGIDVTPEMWESCYVDGIALTPSAAFPAMIDAILAEGGSE